MNIENYLFDKKWDKLIKPLEEYLLELAKKNPLYTNLNVNLPWVSILWVHETILISKKFWFIKWLLKNDKIDLLRLTCMNPRYTEILDSDFSWEERIIMILSIQDSPIEFLVNILR